MVKEDVCVCVGACVCARARAWSAEDLGICKGCDHEQDSEAKKQLGGVLHFPALDIFLINM